MEIYVEESFYNKNGYEKLLKAGTYKGCPYFIITFGTHPCCYIGIDSNNKFYKKHYDDIPIQVHGGLTFACPTSKFKYFNKDNYWIIGWDYLHYGDYLYWLNYGKKWTLKELEQAIYTAIDNLIELNN